MMEKHIYDCLDCHAHVETPSWQEWDKTCTACGSNNIKRKKPKWQIK